jgi:hypothetical protein
MRWITAFSIIATMADAEIAGSAASTELPDQSMR